MQQLKKSRLLRAGLASAGLRVCTVLITVFSSILLARMLGPQNMGFYAFALSVVTLAGLPVQFGVPVLVLRETARAESISEWGVVRGVWAWGFRRISVAGLVALPAIGIGSWLLHGAVVPEGGLTVLWLALPLVPLLAIVQLHGSALRGLHRPLLGQIPEGLIRPGTLLIVLGGLAAAGLGAGAETAMLIHVAAAGLACAASIWFLRRAMPAAVQSAASDRSGAAAWRRAIWPLALISGMQILMQNFNIMLLGTFRSPEEVALYRIAVSAANMTLIGMSVINIVVAPSFAKLNAGMERGEMARTAQVSAAVSMAAALPLACVLIFAGPFVLSLLYGEAYLGAASAMAVLALAQLVNAFYGSCGNILNMTGNERDAARALMAGTCANAVLNMVLIPIWGGTGAALAALCSVFLWNGLMERAVRQRLGFSSSAAALLLTRKKEGRPV